MFLCLNVKCVEHKSMHQKCNLIQITVLLESITYMVGKRREMPCVDSNNCLLLTLKVVLSVGWGKSYKKI